jgi:hypothetical protein
MKTKTKNSTAFMAFTMVLAIVLWIGYQSLGNIPETQVQAADINHTQNQVSGIRDSIVSFLKAKIDTNTQKTISNTTSSVTSWSSSTAEVLQTTKTPKKVHENCIPEEANDIAWHNEYDALNRWLNHCLISTQSNNRAYPDNHLTHAAMLIIADRLGYNVDLQMGWSDVVTRSEMMKFIDFLQSTHQISMIPAIPFSTIVTRAEYLSFMKKITIIIPEKSNPTILTNTGSITTPIDKPTSHNTAPATLTIKDFKEIMNKNNNAWFVINSYDAQIIATPEIIASLLSDINNWGTDHTNTQKIDLNTIGLNKEMIKESLSWIAEKI